jgi:hypothetical protein
MTCIKIHVYLNNGNTIHEHHNLLEKLQHINIESTKPIPSHFHKNFRHLMSTF